MEDREAVLVHEEALLGAHGLFVPVAVETDFESVVDSGDKAETEDAVVEIVRAQGEPLFHVVPQRSAPGGEEVTESDLESVVRCAAAKGLSLAGGRERDE